MKMAAPPPWFKFAVLDDQQRPYANVANAIAALRHEPALCSLFTFDDMRKFVIVEGAVPVAHSAGVCGNMSYPRALTDADVVAVQEYMQHAGLPRIGKETIRDAILRRARERAFHPLREYLTGTAWDGRPRLTTWLSTYLGAVADEYTAVIGRMFMISAVARVLNPGCKVDHVLVLQGEQGIEKSKACAVLGGEWFSDSLPNLRDKDSQQFLRGKWFVEIPELAAFRNADVQLLKAFITRANEDYRPSYGREEVREPRHCVFVATTNDRVFIKDETGGRRFWPVQVHKADIERLAADRDQLFAEAVAAFRGGEHWWPDKDFEQSVIKAEQEARREVEPWAEIIGPWIENLDSVLIGVVAREALGISVPRLSKADSNRIAAVLLSLGYRRADKKDGKGYFPYYKT